MHNVRGSRTKEKNRLSVKQVGKKHQPKILSSHASNQKLAISKRSSQIFLTHYERVDHGKHHLNRRTVSNSAPARLQSKTKIGQVHRSAKQC